ncbi:MAG: beta-hydroxyacyl-ACP dehydratase [Coriobacteriia bacterium]|nr:beta-hydroxyacyl-ACP dehydratase [Coriobacteriia bacterium]
MTQTSSQTYSHEELKALLPHRDPMLLLDSVTLDEEEGGESGSANSSNRVARGKLEIRGDEFFLQGHFPGNPLLPGVIQCEILAQTCCVLLGQEAAAAEVTPVYTGLTNVKFRRPVRPGETFDSEVSITRQRGMFYWASGVGHVGDETCVQADFSFALVPNEAATASEANA